MDGLNSSCIFVVCEFRFAQGHPDGSHYFVLLILTDGVISDMQNTKASIVAVSTKATIVSIWLTSLNLYIFSIFKTDFEPVEWMQDVSTV